MTIWGRYGYTNCHPDYPWWACAPTDVGVDLVRSDGRRVPARDGVIRFTGEEMTAEVERIDRRLVYGAELLGFRP